VQIGISYGAVGAMPILAATTIYAGGEVISAHRSVQQAAEYQERKQVAAQEAEDQCAALVRDMRVLQGKKARLVSQTRGLILLHAIYVSNILIYS
jgi:hypothetical protein